MSSLLHASDLLRCPFCGRPPRTAMVLDHLAGNGYFNIDCCAEMTECFILGEYKPKKKDSMAHAQETITNRWNTRCQEAA